MPPEVIINDDFFCMAIDRFYEEMSKFYEYLWYHSLLRDKSEGGALVHVNVY